MIMYINTFLSCLYTYIFNMKQNNKDEGVIVVIPIFLNELNNYFF